MKLKIYIESRKKYIAHITAYYAANNGEIINYMAYDVNCSSGYNKMTERGECVGTVYGIEGLVSESLIDGDHLLQPTYQIGGQQERHLGTF